MPRVHLLLIAALIIIALSAPPGCSAISPQPAMKSADRQVTFAPYGHVLTNVNVWSPDSRRIVYDIRSDADGSSFDGTRIEMVDVASGEVRVLYESNHGASCGVATYSPNSPTIAFILGPEHPTADWTYGAARRQGVLVDERKPGMAVALDARDLTPPFTPGALRGGSHVHVFSPAGDLVSFTYEDHLLSAFPAASKSNDINQRNVGVSVLGRPVTVSKDHPRNHDGQAFTVLVTRTTANPRPGSDDYSRAFEESWIGIDGYLHPDGTRQRRALAFQGNVATPAGATISEVFIADLPDDLTQVGDGPLEGTDRRMPHSPRGVNVRRLTRTADRKHPGIQGPRHWLRSSPDGGKIAFLMKDDAGVVQLWTISPLGGEPRQLTQLLHPVASAFTWSPDGRQIAFVMDNSVCTTDTTTGEIRRLTERASEAESPLPLACVFSPDGKMIAYQRRVGGEEKRFNQVFVVGAE